MSRECVTTGREGGERAWWKEAVVYQIYPRSFNDSDGDGVGDLRGITERADYLDELGVDVVWLTPIYDSPQADNGYDVRDYRTIDDQFGSMDDWERLRDELHDRDIRIVMDLVVNHTSDEHEWFRRSRAGEDDYEDWYVWKDGDPDEPPNNWESCFGGSAWTYDDEREAWYLHLFHEKQPDLNWENPDVRDAVAEMMNWWLDRGIDGFRMDVINVLSKPRSFPDGDPAGGWTGIEQCVDGPRLEEFLSELLDRTVAGTDAMTVGETIGVDPEMARRLSRAGLDQMFHFDHVELDYHDEAGWWQLREWDLPEFKRVFSEWQEGLGEEGWPTVFLGNHDQPRSLSRFGDDEGHRAESAKLLGTFLLTMRGTPYLYQGDEIGMTNYPFDDIDELDDPLSAGRVRNAMENGEVESFDDVKHLVRARSRDNSRTPMQWDDRPNAGFTEGDPWMAPHPNYDEVNVARQRDAEGSVLEYYRRLLELRQESDVLAYGDYELLAPDHESFYAYVRSLDDERLLTVLNFSGSYQYFEADVEAEEPELLVANYDDAPPDPRGDEFRPWEARVCRL